MPSQPPAPHPPGAPDAEPPSGVLGVIHRGVIRIADEERFVVFGNDGYSDPGTQRIVSRLLKWLERGGHEVEQLVTDAHRYTWAVVLAPDSMAADFGGARRRITRLLWRIWIRTPNNGRTSFHAREHQWASAEAELEAIGGGYRGRDLARPLAGKGGRLRGVTFINEVLLAQSEGQEEVHVLLGGVPYPARVSPAFYGAGVVSDGTVIEVEPPVAVEWVVLLEGVGDPRSESHDFATAFVPKGQSIPVTDTGTRHEVTGQRVLIPTDPMTGEPHP